MEMINKVCKVMINDQVLAIRMVKEMFTYPLIDQNSNTSIKIKSQFLSEEEKEYTSSEAENACKSILLEDSEEEDAVEIFEAIMTHYYESPTLKDKQLLPLLVVIILLEYNEEEIKQMFITKIYFYRNHSIPC